MSRRYSARRTFNRMARSKSLRAHWDALEAETTRKEYVRVAGNHTLTCRSVHCKNEHDYYLSVHWKYEPNPAHDCIFEHFTDAESANRRFYELVEFYEECAATGNS